MRCFYCGKRVSLVRKRSDADFCSDEHRRLYHARTRRSLDRLQEAEERLAITRLLNEGFPVRPGLEPQRGTAPEQLLHHGPGASLAFRHPAAQLPVSRPAVQVKVEAAGRILAGLMQRSHNVALPSPEGRHWQADVRRRAAPRSRMAPPATLPTAGARPLAGNHRPQNLANRNGPRVAAGLDAFTRAPAYPRPLQSAPFSPPLALSQTAYVPQMMKAPPAAEPAHANGSRILPGIVLARSQAAVLFARVSHCEPVCWGSKPVEPRARRPQVERPPNSPRYIILPVRMAGAPVAPLAGPAGIPKTGCPRNGLGRQRQYPWERFAKAPAQPGGAEIGDASRGFLREPAPGLALAPTWGKALESRLDLVAESWLPAGSFPGASLLPLARRTAPAHKGLALSRHAEEQARAREVPPRPFPGFGWEAGVTQTRFQDAAREQNRPEWHAGVAEAVRATEAPRAKGEGSAPRVCAAGFATRARTPSASRHPPLAGLTRTAPAAAVSAPLHPPGGTGARAEQSEVRPSSVFPGTRRRTPVLRQAEVRPHALWPIVRITERWVWPAAEFGRASACRRPGAAGVSGIAESLTEGPAVAQAPDPRDLEHSAALRGWDTFEPRERATGGMAAPRAASPAGALCEHGWLPLRAPASAERPAHPAAEPQAPLDGPAAILPATSAPPDCRLASARLLAPAEAPPRNTDARPEKEPAGFAPRWALPGAVPLAAREWGKNVSGAVAQVEPFYEDFANGLVNWEGDLSGWRQDIAGVRPGALALLRPSRGMADYRLEFLGRIETRSVACVLRAADAGNYQAVKIEAADAGASSGMALIRYAVIEGKAETPVRRALAAPASPKAPLKVQVVVEGDDFTLSLDGKPAERWTEDRLPEGGVGFFSDGDDRARLYWVKVSPLDDGQAEEFAALAPVRSSNLEMTMGE